MQHPHHPPHKDPFSCLMIGSGAALLLLFFFSWRAILFAAGILLILAGCSRFHHP